MSLLEGDYTWTEDRNERWIHVWTVLSHEPLTSDRIRLLDAVDLGAFLTNWAGASPAFSAKSVVISPLLRHHKGQLRYDLARVGVDVDGIIAETIPWNTAWDHISEILKDPSSHTVAAVHGHRYVPSPGEIAAWDIHEREMNAKRPKGAIYKRFPRPWAGKPPVYDAPAENEMTPEREARRAKLDAMF